MLFLELEAFLFSDENDLGFSLQFSGAHFLLITKYSSLKITHDLSSLVTLFNLQVHKIFLC